MPIAFDRFFETKRGDFVDFRQVAIQHDAHTPDRADHCVDLLDCDGGTLFSSPRARKIIQSFSDEKPPFAIFRYGVPGEQQE
jgi:hypothetical protein